MLRFVEFLCFVLSVAEQPRKKGKRPRAASGHGHGTGHGQKRIAMSLDGQMLFINGAWLVDGDFDAANANAIALTAAAATDMRRFEEQFHFI